MLNDLFWDGEMDCGWEELSDLLIRTCRNFTDIMLRTTEISPNAESREMISDKCMERFESITGILADIVKDGGYYA